MSERRSRRRRRPYMQSTRFRRKTQRTSGILHNEIARCSGNENITSRFYRRHRRSSLFSALFRSACLKNNLTTTIRNNQNVHVLFRYRVSSCVIQRPYLYAILHSQAFQRLNVCLRVFFRYK